MEVCKIDGCCKKVYQSGMCRPHHRKDRLYGDPHYTFNGYGRKYHTYEYIEGGRTIKAYTMKGEPFFIDSDDLPIIQNVTFHTDDLNYLYGGNRSIKTKQLHRLIMGDPDGMVIDHIDGDPLNNRKSNLRICSVNENIWNSRKRKNNKSGHKGVSWDSRKSKWRATIGHLKKHIHIGYYDDIEDAVSARIEKEEELFGQFARRE